MIFYLRYNDAGRIFCYGDRYISRQEFKEYLSTKMNSYPDSLFTEVPHSCVKKLFGSNNWIGFKDWPK